MSTMKTTILGMALMSVRVSAQSSEPPSLGGYLSAVQSLASMLGPAPTSPSSSPSSTISSMTSSSPMSSASSFITSSLAVASDSSIVSAASSFAASSASSAAAATASSAADTADDGRTRTIALAVAIPVGLILLAALIALVLLCCRRRRRRGDKRIPKTTETAYTKTQDWEHTNTFHGGFGNKTSIHSDPRPGYSHHSQADVAPLIAAHQGLPPAMSEHPAHRGMYNSPRAENPFATPITRKPVPGRDSTGSAISSTSAISALSSRPRDSHHAGLVAGAGAIAGAVAMNHHDNRHSANPASSRPESWHRPLSSHPSNLSMYGNSPQNDAVVQEPRRSSTPFSPDDVGVVHSLSPRMSQGSSARMSQGSNHRMSQGPIEPSVAAHGADMYGSGAYVGPTKAQRRSLQSRNSSYSDSRDGSRDPSRSPRRRSLSGGGEMWQADPFEDVPPLPTENRYSGETWVSSSTPPMPVNPRRYSNGFRPSDAPTAPALPSNRHNPMLSRPRFRQDGYGNDSSTSNESWESAQAELPQWSPNAAADDPGRYPRFSGTGVTNSMAPLLPPAMAWNEKQPHRWSGGNGYSGERPSHGDQRRYSGASERRQKLRFSEGGPDLYDEHGLVGRAL